VQGPGRDLEQTSSFRYMTEFSPHVHLRTENEPGLAQFSSFVKRERMQARLQRRRGGQPTSKGLRVGRRIASVLKGRVASLDRAHGKLCA
jgi:hypothetical protein